MRLSPLQPLFLLSLALVATLSTGPAGASLPVDVPIVNADFEADSIASPGSDQPTITGWDTTAGGGDGIFRPTAGDYPQGIPSGQNVAYINLPGNRVRQVLTTPFEASTRYRLSVEVGWNQNDPFEGYVIQLRANGTILASQDSVVMPRQGEFVTAVLEYVSPVAHDDLGQPLEIWLLAPGIQANYDDVRLTAETLGTCAETLLVPFYLVDRSDAHGTNTLFAVRNLTGATRSVDIHYHGIGGSLQRTETVTLAAFETRTISIRDVPGLGTGPNDFARGFVRIVTTGSPDRSPVLGGDFFQVDVANNFATGEKMVRGGDLCTEASIRFLDFGAGTRLTIFVNQPRGTQAGDPESFTIQVRDEAGDPSGGLISVFTTAHAVELDASELSGLDFGNLDFDFSNSLGGVVYAEYSAQGRFSVGVTSECEDSRPCDSDDCCPPGAPKATAPPLFYTGAEFPTCVEAIDDAVRALDSVHYRNACQDTYGGDLPSGVLGARVLGCRTVDGSIEVMAEVCCPES